MRYSKTRSIPLIQAVVWLFLAASAFGQAAPPKPMTEAEFTLLLQTRLKQVDTLPDLDAATKGKLKELYEQALTEMTAIKHWVEKSTQYETSATEAPAEINKTKVDLAAMPAQPIARLLPGNYTLLQIEQEISKRDAELTKLRKALADDEEELKGRATRRAKIPEQINEAKKSQAAIEAQIQASAQNDDKSATGTAMRLLLVAQRRRVEQEILCCEKELAAYEARTVLLPLRRDYDARQVAQAEQDIKQWQDIANQRRRQEVEQQVEQASHEAGQAHPNVQILLDENKKLAADREPLAESIVEITRQRDIISQKLTEVSDRYTSIQGKYTAVGETNVTDMIGLMLRKQRDALPNLREYQRNIELHKQTQRDIQLTLLQLQDDHKALVDDLDQTVQGVLKRLNVTESSADRGQIEAAVREALKSKLEYIDALIRDNNTYFDKLVDLTQTEQQLVEKVALCANFIDQRVLWIASSSPLAASDIQWANRAFWWLFEPNSWIEVGRTLVVDARRKPMLWSAALLMFLALFYWRMRFRARIVEIGEKAARGNCYLFRPTLETTLLTFMLAIGWPGLMYYLGWRLTAYADVSYLCQAVGPGLTETARVFFALELLQLTCGRQGLGESHFGWSPAALKLLRHQIRWFSPPALVLMAIAVAMAWQERNDRWDPALGRIAFIAALLCFSYALYRILRPGSPMFQAIIVNRRGGWLERFRYVWYPFCVLTPLALAVMAVVGYHYTARQLTIRLILTVYVLVGGIVARALLLRWTMLSQRKLAIEAARQRRAAQIEGNSGEETAGTATLPATPEPERDLATINIQTRRLIEYSLAVAALIIVWCAWVDVLPALGKVNWGLWPTTVAVAKEVTTPDGKSLTFVEQYRWVKMADLLLAAIVLATTLIAAKNIPGLLEMAILQHLPFDAGARYAVSTVCRYTITVVGLFLFCLILGISWSKAQWLVAAMGLGLGFGLQEIFANFISGLIILFERPVRVGDVVTLGDVTGVVSRIRMRATTITDGDRKELIIPNKDFITGRVLNWTLTDPINRVVINVGVAYGTDAEQAAQLLRKVAQDHPNVLDDPAPMVSLESFGDSSLNFVLRCFLPNLENRTTVINDLHMAIEREFRAAGIEIPFPQHEIRIRANDAAEPVLQSVGGGGGIAPWPIGAPKYSGDRAA